MPVSTRHDDGQGVPDNRVSTLLYDLPVHIADPVERLEVVHAQMTELKASHMAEAGEVVVALGNLAPPMVVGPMSRMVIRSIHRLPQRSINTITTNVPGPQFPLYCLGHEMLEYRPFVPISHGIRVSTAILSYNGRLFFGITGDYETAPDVRRARRGPHRQASNNSAIAPSPASARPDPANHDTGTTRSATRGRAEEHHSR